MQSANKMISMSGAIPIDFPQRSSADFADPPKVSHNLLFSSIFLFRSGRVS